jgi:Apolipoprotein N-acyltransferase
MAPRALIGYEIAYAGIARQQSRNANAILTVSNDTWFGHSIGPNQHHEIAQIRARELAKPVIRATNDGLSTLINARGDITHQLPRFERGVLMGTITPSETVTPL